MDGVVSGSIVTFGPWRYDRRLGRLFRSDAAGGWAPTAIGSRANAILAAMLRDPGALVSKDALMDAVWPGVSVEPNNLTVQVAALRRVLDDGAPGKSCIQTVPGRGYRIVCQVDDAPAPAPAAPPADVAPAEAAELPAIVPAAARSRVPRWWLVGFGATLAAVAMLALVVYRPLFAGSPPLPRMSVLVLPFENLGGSSAEGRLAEAVTDDLTAALSLTRDVAVVNGKVSRAREVFSERVAPERVGRERGARYVLTGSERRLADTLWVSAQIVSAESAAVMWTDRFEVNMADLAAGQSAAVERLRNGVEVRLITLEAARSQAERPDTPDAFDLVLRARLLELRPPSPGSTAEIRSLYERAVRLDPSSDVHKLVLLSVMLDDEDQNPHGRKAVLERTRELLATVTAKQPQSWMVLLDKIYWLAWQESRRCPEVIDEAERYLTKYSAVGPLHQVYRWLGACKIVLGHADEAVGIMERAIPVADGESYRSHDYRNLQLALLLLGRYDESIRTGERALAANPDDVGYERARLDRRLAAAYALSGRVDVARRKLAEAERIQPYFTLRMLDTIENADPIYVAQVAREKAGLRLAGMRDHAEEDADLGLPADGRLHQNVSGPTPVLAPPGATTIRTDDLVRLLADRKPVVVDALSYFAGRSIPGAVGLRYVGDGGELSDLAQDRLKTAMRTLTKGDPGTPVVAVGWNSESFDGRNLALRLVALGYTHVHWYRGGREAWEARELPEADLVEQEW